MCHECDSASLPLENAVELVLEQGSNHFQGFVSRSDQIAELLDRQGSGVITPHEESEFDAFEEIDDYLSHVNRLIRNSREDGERSDVPRLKANLP